MSAQMDDDMYRIITKAKECTLPEESIRELTTLRRMSLTSAPAENPMEGPLAGKSDLHA